MKKRLVAISGAIAVVALAAGASPAAGSSAGAAKPRPMRVLAVITEVNFIDAGAPGPSLGDEIVFSNKLLHGTSQVGHDGAVCTTVSLERNEAVCIATFSLRGGQITAQALVALGSTAPYNVAITGGTGRYEGARGQIHVQPVSDTEGIHTFHLED